MARIATEKERAHELIDRLAPSQISAIVSVLHAMLDPVARAIATAPIDDEDETAGERKAVAQSKQSFKQHPGHTTDELMAELGIDPTDAKPKA